MYKEKFRQKTGLPTLSAPVVECLESSEDSIDVTETISEYVFICVQIHVKENLMKGPNESTSPIVFLLFGIVYLIPQLTCYQAMLATVVSFELMHILD